MAAPVGVRRRRLSAATSVEVTAQFGSRTSLKVSTQLLQFDVRRRATSQPSIVDFSAAARTQHGGEVVLTVEPSGALRGPGGAADVETALTFSGDGTRHARRRAQPSSPSVAGRWIGSGLRTGRLTFALRAVRRRPLYGAGAVRPPHPSSDRSRDQRVRCSSNHPQLLAAGFADVASGAGRRLHAMR